MAEILNSNDLNAVSGGVSTGKEITIKCPKCGKTMTITVATQVGVGNYCAGTCACGHSIDGYLTDEELNALKK